MASAMRRLWAVPVGWRVALVAAMGLPVAAFMLLVVQPWSIVGRAEHLTVDIPAGGCTNITMIRFAGHTWESNTPVPESWGYGTESGRFRVASPHTAEFVSDADGKGVGLYRVDGFSSLPCMVGFGA
jgi:hypothetical protein